jgi:predicted transcriptional regulator
MARSRSSSSTSSTPPITELGRRERQIVEAVYRLGRASVSDVRNAIEDPPSYSAVRAMLNLLEEKGHLRHVQDGLRYLYLPVVETETASRSAMAHVVATFFGGSPADAASALLDLPGRKWSKDELEELSRHVKQALKEGR